MHVCYRVDTQIGPAVGCGCEKSRRNWLKWETAVAYLRDGVAKIRRGGKSLVLAGRLPRYFWPRMVTAQVILGNVTGSKRDQAYLRDLLALGAGTQPVAYNAKVHRAAFEGRAMITSWLDQRSKGLQK
jgi:hypothetical protein